MTRSDVPLGLYVQGMGVLPVLLTFAAAGVIGVIGAILIDRQRRRPDALGSALADQSTEGKIDAALSLRDSATLLIPWVVLEGAILIAALTLLSLHAPALWPLSALLAILTAAISALAVQPWIRARRKARAALIWIATTPPYLRAESEPSQRASESTARTDAE